MVNELDQSPLFVFFFGGFNLCLFRISLFPSFGGSRVG